MNALLNRLSFSKRIIILMMIPLCGLSIFSIVTILDHIQATKQTQREIDSVTELTELGTVIAEAIHEWQKERGRSAGYLGSAGKKFSSEIRSQHRSSDQTMATLRQAIQANDYSLQPPEFHAALDKSVSLMEKVPGLRNEVLALKIKGGDAVGQYTKMITSFLSVIDTSAKLTQESDISLLLVSYSNFLRAKENMGIERAVLSNAFGADAFKADFYKRYCTVLANQAAYLSSFQAFALPEHIQFYKRTVRGPSVDKVSEWEALAFAKADTGGFGVRPEDWFTEITAKIDLMKTVEDHIANSVRQSSEQIASANSSKFYTLVSTAAALITLTLGLSYWVATFTSRSLRETVSRLHQGVDEVAAASGQVSQASIAMANAANEQSTSLNHTSGILSNITDITRSNGELAGNANAITAEARKMVDNSLEEMRTLQNAMDEIRTSSDEISAIIKTIDEIAFQTNILALNAAVEAARAGQAGTGFAVVADEVRNLAQRSAQAANDTTQKIEDSIKRAHNGTSISSSVGSVLENIVGKVREVDDVVTKIDEASQNQLAAILEVQSAVRSQEEVVMGASTSTEETASAAEELHSQAGNMQASIRDLALQAGIAYRDENLISATPAQTQPASHSAQNEFTPSRAKKEEELLWN
ncbi:methyl-accepting chemotaxis protein [Pelagicoccus mobilis]|uniref:Methyl-accepting chemotaxis protein n=1 Tax=Pelagicoccus mobilis TaxID=415221 RepID=A0A934VJ53_9BACT|nr:methyl-accepting chemotaxis protein [Pelagicoccus mobilis]MBK1875241.1 methyl-accepting chemotaxis protein [Pelagicoccus mobilis]